MAQQVAGRLIPPVTAVPAITAGAYAAGQAIGGLLTFDFSQSNWPASIHPRSGYIVNVQVKDASGQKAPLQLVLFSQTFTATADKAAFAPSTADLANIVKVIDIDVSDYSSFSANAVADATLESNAAMREPFIQSGGVAESKLYGQLVARDAVTYVGVADLTIALFLELGI